MNHRHYAAWKHTNRVIGSGEFMMTVGSNPDPKATVAKLFPEFAGRGQDSWGTLDAPSKINRIGKVVPRQGEHLWARMEASTLCRRKSSMVPLRTAEAFQSGTEEQMVDILTAVGHAVSGFLTVFASVQACTDSGRWSWTSRTYSSGGSRLQLGTSGSLPDAGAGEPT